MTDTSTAGVITDNTRLQTTEDYKYSVATDNAWHQHVLTYNGEGRPLPTLQYFVDGQEMVGNARLESGQYRTFGRQYIYIYIYLPIAFSIRRLYTCSIFHCLSYIWKSSQSQSENHAEKWTILCKLYLFQLTYPVTCCIYEFVLSVIRYVVNLVKRDKNNGASI